MSLFLANLRRRTGTTCRMPSGQHGQARIELPVGVGLTPDSPAERRAISQLKRHGPVGVLGGGRRKVLRLARSSTSSKPTSTAISMTGSRSVRGQTSSRHPERRACFVRHVTPLQAGQQRLRERLRVVTTRLATRRA